MSELPGYLALAWGKQERPSRGPKPGLSLERIVAAGVAVADAEGLAGLSMSRIAEEVGAKPMSLYRYVGSKDDLVILMIDHAGGPPPLVDAPDWRSGLAQWCWAYLGMLRAHPWILQVPISAPPATPNQLRWLEAGLRAADRFGVGDKMQVMLLLSGYVRNWATLSADIDAAHPDAQEMMAGYGAALRALVDPAEFPELAEVIAAGVFDYNPDESPDADFTFGLDRILDGIERIATG